jgi:alanine-glyoxylate transaminase/serine-glyoxylate transaminase/serine-pyruvate transaminase
VFLLVDGDKVVVCINGVFGMRMQENITRFGGVAVVVEDDWGTAVSLDKVEQTLKDNADAKILAFVHAETSTGARSDAKALCKIAHDNNCITIVDAVTSLGSLPSPLLTIHDFFDGVSMSFPSLLLTS